MKIAVISDIHIGPAGYHKGVMRKLTKYSGECTQFFVEQVNAKIRPDFVVQLGDLIEDSNYLSDLENYQKGVELFRPLHVPVYHVVGDHETIKLKEDELREILGIENLYYSFEFGDYHFVVLFSDVTVRKPKRIVLPDAQLEWLQNTLSQTDKPTVIFLHHSLADQDLTGNFWFEGLPGECLVENRREIRGILASSGKVVVVINGHLHWNSLVVHHGIPYITVQSLVENFSSDGIPAQAYGILELNRSLVKLEVLGNAPTTISQKLRTIAI